MSELIKGRIELNTTPDEYQVLDQLREDYCALIDLVQYRAYQHFLRTGKVRLEEEKVYEILNGLEYKFPHPLKKQVAEFYLERTEMMRTYRLPMRPRPYHMSFKGSSCFFTEQNKELKIPGVGTFKLRRPDVVTRLGEIVEFGFVRLPKKWNVIVISKPLTEEESLGAPVLARDMSLENWLKTDRRDDEKVYKPEFQPERGRERYSAVLKLITDEKINDRLEEMSLIQHRVFNAVWEEFLKEYKIYDSEVNIESQVSKIFTKLKGAGKINIYGYPTDLGRSVRKEINCRFNQHRLGIKDMTEFKPHKVEDMHYFYSTSGRTIFGPTYREVVIAENLFVKFEGDLSGFNEDSYTTYLFFKERGEWYLRVTQATEESKKLCRMRWSQIKAERTGLAKTL